MSDAELIRLWREGNAAAFEALVRRWQQPIARFLYRYVGSEDGVSDLCQEVFLRLSIVPAPAIVRPALFRHGFIALHSTWSAMPVGVAGGQLFRSSITRSWTGGPRRDALPTTRTGRLCCRRIGPFARTITARSRPASF